MTPRVASAILPQRAGILCGDAQFRRWVGTQMVGRDIEVTPEAAATWLRKQCGVDSRADLATNPDAARTFETLRTEYDAWRGAIGRPR